MSEALTSDLSFPVIITRHPRSRRITVRVHPVKRCAILNVPKRASVKQAVEFLRKKQSWVEARLAQYKPASVVVANGMELSILGERTVLRQVSGQRGASLENGVLTLGGDKEFLPRRLRDFLVKHAKQHYTRLVEEKLRAQPEFAGKKVTITVRDMTSRWGSCTRKGRLCFNWRLVLAPPYVADYLVCHEMAHLVHLNHSARFWALVDQICPHAEQAKRWLLLNNTALYTVV